MFLLSIVITRSLTNTIEIQKHSQRSTEKLREVWTQIQKIRATENIQLVQKASKKQNIV